VVVVILAVLGVYNSPIYFVFLILDYFWTPSGQMVVSALVNGSFNPKP